MTTKSDIRSLDRAICDGVTAQCGEAELVAICSERKDSMASAAILVGQFVAIRAVAINGDLLAWQSGEGGKQIQRRHIRNP